MKQLILVLFAISMFSCKKDGSGSGSQKMLLTKTFRKGLMEQEHIYSSDGKKIRTNYYLTGGGSSTLSTYRLYQYGPDGLLKEIMHYSQDHYATVRELITYNAQGKVSRIDEASIFAGGDDLDDMDYFEIFNYDVKGNLTQVTRRLTNYTMHSTDEYEYDDKGNMVKFEGRYWENGALVLKQRLVMVPGSKQMPEHWKQNLVRPTDDNLYEHYLDKKTFTSWWGPENISVYTYNTHAYNSQGYVTTLNFMFKSGASETANALTFEYVLQ